MRRLAVLTAGGHSLDVAAMAAQSGWEPVFYDDDPDIGEIPRWKGRTPLPLPLSLFAGDTPAVVGHNEPAWRQRIAQRFPDAEWVSLFHRSVIGWPELWEDGCIVASGAIITERVTFGRHVHVNVGATISQATNLGDFCTVGPGCHIAGDVTVGAGTWFGVGSIVRDHISIGENVMVGAGAVVCSDIPDGTTVVGVPAKPLLRVENDHSARQALAAQDRLAAR